MLLIYHDMQKNTHEKKLTILFKRFVMLKAVTGQIAKGQFAKKNEKIKLKKRNLT